MAKAASYIIRTYNEERMLKTLLDNLDRQLCDGVSTEVIVVDSGSTDDSVELARRAGAAVLSIDREDFNYSRALNLGIEHAAGELIIILSAHSIPAQPDWLRQVITDFDDPLAGGAYYRQIAWPDASWHERERIERTFKSQSMRFQMGGPTNLLRFSNAASCIRRDLWEKHPFALIPASEDREWAHWAIRNGYRILYNASASVYHSHLDRPRIVARRRIEVEVAADIKFGRKRNRLLTMREAMHWLLSDFKKSASTDLLQGKTSEMRLAEYPAYFLVSARFQTWY